MTCDGVVSSCATASCIALYVSVSKRTLRFCVFCIAMSLFVENVIICQLNTMCQDVYDVLLIVPEMGVKFQELKVT